MSVTIPDISRCLELIEDFSMLKNIRRHSFMVARVASTVHQGLAAANKAVPTHELVLAGALLHDIAKTRCLAEGCAHAETGAAICEELGYPAVADIVASHVLLPQDDQACCRNGQFTATELVYYADKRVLHDRIVSLEERLEYILEKYGTGNPFRELLIRQNFLHCQQLEEQLFSHLPFSADETEKVVQQKDWAKLNLHYYPPLNNRATYSDLDSK